MRRGRRWDGCLDHSVELSPGTGSYFGAARSRIPPPQPRQWLQSDSGTSQRAPAWQAAAPHPLSPIVDIRYVDTLGAGNQRRVVTTTDIGPGRGWAILAGRVWKRRRTHRGGLSPSSGRSPDARFQVEPGVPTTTLSELRSRGHIIEEVTGRQPGWGPVSIIEVDGDHRSTHPDPRVDTTSAVTF